MTWLIWKILEIGGGYKGTTPPDRHDCWHYWSAPLNIVRLPFDLIGATYVKEYVKFTFPVLFIRSKADRIAVSLQSRLIPTVCSG